MSSIRTQIYLDESQHVRLKELGRKQRTSLANLIRKSIDNYLQSIEHHPIPKGRDSLLDIIGIGRSKARNVSNSHDRYIAESIKKYKRR